MYEQQQGILEQKTVLLLPPPMPKKKDNSYFVDDPKKPHFSLFLGDCREVLKQFPNNHFDMIFADPPYNLSNGGFTVHAGRQVSVNKGNWDKSRGVDADFESIYLGLKLAAEF